MIDRASLQIRYRYLRSSLNKTWILTITLRSNIPFSVDLQQMKNILRREFVKQVSDSST